MKQKYISPEVVFTRLAFSPFLDTSSLDIIGDDETDEMLTKEYKNNYEQLSDWGNLW